MKEEEKKMSMNELVLAIKNKNNGQMNFIQKLEEKYAMGNKRAVKK